MPDAIPTEQQLIDQITRLNVIPAAIQAMWDGDSRGWFLRIEVVSRLGGEYTRNGLALLRFGGDLRLFNGHVPPWPESQVASRLGESLASHFAVPFYFPSPHEPDDNCPDWWKQDQAIPCQSCGKLIIPTNSPHLPKDMCYPCHIKNRSAPQ